MKTKEKPKGKFVDPAVSLAKFEREVALYRENEDDYIRRGWWMVKAEYPQVFMVFGTTAVAPPMVPFGALIDFTNYDMWAPSVQIVNPFSREPYLRSQLPIPPMPRRRLIEQREGQAPVYNVEELLQAESPDSVPFICVPGVREYHEHPAHSGDSWFLHRNRGEGTLYYVLNILSTYGVGSVKGMTFQLQITPSGFQGPATVEQVPE